MNERKNDRTAFFKSVSSIKEAQAEGNVVLVKKEIKIENATILDVGMSAGFNTKALQSKGAKVIGVEIEKDACEFAIEKNGIAKEAVYNCSVQELPSEMNGKFDLACIFLYAISLDQCNEVFKRIARNCLNLQEN